MSVLKSLTLTAIPRAAMLTPEEHRRSKLLKHLNEQLAIAQADIAGTIHVVKKRHWQLTEEGGKDLIEVEKRLKRWWSQNAAGGYILAVKWGSKAMELDKGKDGIAVKDLPSIVVLLEKLIKAAEAGEFDALISKTNELRLANRNKAA